MISRGFCFLRNWISFRHPSRSWGERLDLTQFRQTPSPFGRECRESLGELVGHDGHGMGQIQGRERGGRGNPHLPMAVLQVFIGKTGAFRPEDDGNFVAGGQCLQLDCHLPGL